MARKTRLEILQGRVESGVATASEVEDYDQEKAFATMEAPHLQRVWDIQAVRDAQSFEELKDAVAQYLEQHT